MQHGLRLLTKLVVIAGTVAMLSACGGGGGSATTSQADTVYMPPPSTSPDPGPLPIEGCTNCNEFATEYDAQYGLAIINAAGANDAGYTGWNIRTAIVDTGIDANHPEFTNRTLLGRDFGGNGDLAYLSDINGHGTHVAATLAANRDAAGMRGVAYDALLYSYRVDSFGGQFLAGLATDRAWEAVIDQHVTDTIQVSNNSWGSDIPIDAVTESDLRREYRRSIAALERAQQNGTVFVFAAGNNLDFQPSAIGGMPVHISELRDQWLVVVAVDEQGIEPAYTNRCGLAADFCVAAPGNNIYAARANTTGYIEKTGTSMAAPHVAGVVAVVYQQFPELSAEQITNRVKATASLEALTTFDGKTLNTTNLAEMQSVFGHGLVNAEAAVQPISTLVYTTDGSISSEGARPVGDTRLTVLNGMGNAIAQQLKNTPVAVFDSFDGATFFVPASEVFETSHKQPLAAIGYASHAHEAQARQGMAAFASTFADDRSGIPIYVSFSNNAMTAMSATNWGDKVGFMAQPAFLQDQSTQQFEWGLINEGQLSVRPFTQFAQNGDGKLLGAGVNLSFRATDSLRAHVSLAQSEAPFNNSVNGGNSSSALSMNTAELGLEHDVTSNVSVFARSRFTDLGSTAASTEQWGVYGGQILQHQLGVELKTGKAKIALGAYDPGQMQNGDIALLIPYGRTQDGQVRYREQRFSVDQTPKIGAFLAAKAPVTVGPHNLGMVTFSIQQSPYERSRIGRASLNYSHRF